MPSPRAGLTSVVVLSWNSLRLTRVAVEAVLRAPGSLELIVVDNGSSDGSRRWLAGLARRPASAGRRLAVLLAPSNEGFAAGMNRGLAAAGGDAVLFANNDAAPAGPWLERMRAALALRRVGAVCPASNFSAEGAARYAFPGRYRGLAGLERFGWAHGLKPGPDFLEAAGFVPGFWLLCSRRALEQAGGFDARYGRGGYEDWDLQWRLRRAGWRVGFAPRAFVHHVGFGASKLNGLAFARAYGPRARARLTRKFPATARLALETLVPPPATSGA